MIGGASELENMRSPQREMDLFGGSFMKRLLSLLSIICVLAAASLGAQHHKDHNVTPLFEGMGNHSHPVTTKSALARDTSIRA